MLYSFPIQSSSDRFFTRATPSETTEGHYMCSAEIRDSQGNVKVGPESSEQVILSGNPCVYVAEQYAAAGEFLGDSIIIITSQEREENKE